MYEKAMLMFLYADAPVHFGAGVSLGAVDLVIQRERHTGYPMAQGSGLKGALRHHLEWRFTGDEDRERIKWVFGPDGGSEARDHAGAVAFGDARLLLFPVRSLAGTFAYCTSSVALGRLRRDLALTGSEVSWQVPDAPAEGHAWVTKSAAILAGGRLALEDFDVTPRERENVTAVADWIARHALPADPAFEHFRARIRTHLAVLDDNLFAHLTRLATVVEPHVRIDADTGTASDGGFFYAEHLPPDALLWSVVGIARPHGRGEEDKERIARLGIAQADQVGRYLRDELDGRPVQAGAEATTGRGLMHIRFA